MASLTDRRAIVTGASAGLGFGIAAELAARGARLLICSRSADRIGAAADRITERLRTRTPAPGDPAWHPPVTLAADITHPGTAARLAAAAQEAFGGLDILVCCAGGPPPGDFGELDDSHWEDAFRLIVLGPVRMIRSCLPLLRAGGAGRIVLMSSISGLRPVQRLLLSNALRPALMGLSRHLASELASSGILINTIAPGFFDTDRAREVQQAIAQNTGRTLRDVQVQQAARIPLQRMGEPDELGRLVAFLVSEENTYLTGQTLIIDGGLLVAP